MDRTSRRLDSRRFDPRPHGRSRRTALLCLALITLAGAALLCSAAPAHAASGDEAWHRAYDGGVSGGDITEHIAISPDGRAVYIAGWVQHWASPTTDMQDLLLIKYAYTGGRKWVRRYAGPGSGVDQANAVLCDATGNVYVAGSATMVDGYTDLVLIKYDKDGHRTWLRTLSVSINTGDSAWALALDGDGNVYAAGTTSNLLTGNDTLLVKYSRYGRRRWVRTYDSGAGLTDRSNSVVVDRRRGAVYVGGTSNDGVNGGDWLVVKYDLAGNQSWAHTCGTAGASDSSCALALGPADGGVYQVGTFWLPDPAGQATLVKWARDGTQPWTGPAQAANYGGADYFRDVTVDRYGLVHAVGGVMNSSGNYDGFVLTRTADGAPQSYRSVDSFGQNDWFWAVACDGAGNVYATGETNDTVSYGYQYLTAKFPRSTGRVWTATAGESPDSSPDGARDIVLRTGTRAGVYVTGGGQSPTSSYDAFTVKHRP